jgi:hypothetical protein
VGSCECSDEPLGSGTTELVVSYFIASGLSLLPEDGC